ncbi:MAG: L-rhamnose mutarotase [Verrucomicrobia bacterium]|nr:L-rhamnose mutarotase [Verrucomicrobiota bacterium]
MKRRAFCMRLKPGCAAEYRRRHEALWPELRAAFEKAGVWEYSIFLDETTSTLFAVQTLADHHSVADLRELDVVKRWWTYMADILEVGPDGVPASRPLTEVFRMTARATGAARPAPEIPRD